MDEILERYKQGKFQKCLELIKLLPDSDSLADNFAIENCSLVCGAIIALLGNNSEEISETEKKLFLFYENVTSVGLLPSAVPLHIKLTVIYNFYWWLLFHNDKKLSEEECADDLSIINTGLCRVLGKKEENEAVYLTTVEKIMVNLDDLRKLTCNKEPKNFFLFLDIATVLIMYIATVEQDCLKKCTIAYNRFLADLKQGVATDYEGAHEIFKTDIQHSYLFKFGLQKMASTLSELNNSIMNYLQLLESVFYYVCGNYRDSLKSLQNNSNSSLRDLSYYLAALNCYYLCKNNLCLSYIQKTCLSSIESELRMRLLILNGNLCSSNDQHKEAVRHFESAINSSPESPLPIFYLGREWGKMGLYDLMVECFEKLTTVLKSGNKKKANNYSFASIILNWIHPGEEITEDEALYALAVSYGLNERFCDGASMLDEYFLCDRLSTRERDTERIVNVPDALTVLHDASTMNLLAGNLIRAEEIALEAINEYHPRENSFEETINETSLLEKDVDWLRKTIEQELLESDRTIMETKNTKTYPESSIYFLPENVTALLILSEIQRIQEADEYALTLKKVFSCFSTYLGNLTRKEAPTDEEKQVSCLIKALAGKTCLKIARMQMQFKNNSNTEKMLKRSISCNKGDKDVIQCYCRFLIDTGKRREAAKLWRTFHNEETTMPPESVQSFTLRHFLTDQVTIGELEKIQMELQSVDD